MPIYVGGPTTEEELKYKAKTYKCNCGGALLVAWSADHNCYMLRCANKLEHSDFIRPANINNYDLPGYNMPGIMKGKEKQLVTKYGEETTKSLVRAGGGNALSTLTEKAAISMAMILWPEASKSQSGKNAIAKLALICRDYGLNPAMDHVFLIKFDRYEGKGENRHKVGEDWSVVRGIKASRLICGRDKSYGYIDDTPRIMTQDEQKRIFGEVDAESLVAICKLRDKDGNIFAGYGKWPIWKTWGDKRYDNNPQGTDKGNSKFNMACIRAERQALDKLNPGSMPAIDVVDENYIQKPQVVVTYDGTKVDPESGLIQEEQSIDRPIDAEFSEQSGTEESDAAFEKLESARKTEVSTKSKGFPREPDLIKSLGDLYSACTKDWPEKFAVKADVLKATGKTETEITDPAAEYIIIATKMMGKK
jgi:hypothetical protein